MTYEAWRISYQSSEQAARAVYEEAASHRAALRDLSRRWAERAIRSQDWGAATEIRRCISELAIVTDHAPTADGNGEAG